MLSECFKRKIEQEVAAYQAAMVQWRTGAAQMEDQENKNLEMLEKQNARDAQNAMCNLLLTENSYEITDFELFMMKLPKIAARFAALEKTPEDRRSEEAKAALDGWKKTVAQIADILGLEVPVPKEPEKTEPEAADAADSGADEQKAADTEKKAEEESGKSAVYLTEEEQKRLMDILAEDIEQYASKAAEDSQAFSTDLDSAVKESQKQDNQ